MKVRATRKDARALCSSVAALNEKPLDAREAIKRGGEVEEVWRTCETFFRVRTKFFFLICESPQPAAFVRGARVSPAVEVFIFCFVPIGASCIWKTCIITISFADTVFFFFL